jgi:outer membrane protein
LKSTVIGFALAALCVPGFAVAQSKIGFVNSERVMRESDPAQKAQKKLEAEFAGRQKEIAAAADKLRQDADAFQKEAPVMAESQRNERQRALVTRDRDLQQRQQDFQAELNQRRNDELSGVVKLAQAALRDIATKEGFDAIFQDAAYANPKLDITDKVIAALKGK